MDRYIKKHFAVYAVTVAMGMIFAAVNIYIAFLLNQVIDVVMERDFSAFFHMIGKTILYFICITVCHYLYLFFVKLTIKKVLRDLRYDVFKGVLSRSYHDFHSVNTADYISAITNDINILEESYFTPFLYGIQQVCIFSGALIALLSLSLAITFCLILCVLLAMFFPGLYNKVLQKKQRDYSCQLSSFTKVSKDYYNGFEVIKSFGLVPVFLRKFYIENKLLASVKMKKDNAFNFNESISFFFSFFSQLLILLFGAYLILSDHITMGMLVAIIQLSGNFVNPISNIMQAFSKVKSTCPIRDKLTEYAGCFRENHARHDRFVLRDKIILHNVSFCYGDNCNFHLQSINLSIKKGGKYAIIGASGSGKSTLVNLITGRENNYTGEILIDNIPASEIDEITRNELIAVNHQDIFLFEGTVKDNITLFRDYRKEQLDAALIKSGVMKFLPELNEAIDTYVGENGNKLSGGQKQRIALARSFLQEKQILILDEATSAIDMETRFEIENELLHDSGLTLITITHRLSSELLSQYDQIFLLEKGIIIGTGSYEDVMNHKSMSGLSC